MQKAEKYILIERMGHEVSDERAIWLGRHVLPHEPALRAWLRRRNLGGLDVDDIVQETYTRLVSADSVAHILDARSYTFQVAGSVVLDHLRRMRVVSISAAPDYFEVASDMPSPERQVIDRDELQRIARIIAQLPGKIRDVFVLRRIHGLSQREVAARLGLAESTVEKHMSRGFLLISGWLGHGGNSPTRSSTPIPAQFRTVHAKPDRKTD